MKYLLLASATIALAASSVQAQTDKPAAQPPLASVGMDKTEGCMAGPIAQFGRYIGDWNIADETLSREDGKTWIPGKGARWNFTCLGNGTAIQDRKSTRLNSSHDQISYAVFCLKKERAMHAGGGECLSCHTGTYDGRMEG